MTVVHDDYKGRAIRQVPYSLEALSLPQDHMMEYSRGLKSTKFIQEVSGTLGAHTASSRARCAKKTERGERYPWSM